MTMTTGHGNQRRQAGHDRRLPCGSGAVGRVPTYAGQTPAAGVTFCPDRRWNSPPAIRLIFRAGVCRLRPAAPAIAASARRTPNVQDGVIRLGRVALGGETQLQLYAVIGSFGPADLMQLSARIPCGDGVKGFIKSMAIRDLKVFLMLVCRCMPPAKRASLDRRPFSEK
jgi:hypothetical protein